MTETTFTLRKLLGYDNVVGDNGQLVYCPVCKFDYNHILGFETVKGNNKGQAGWWGRGDLIVIRLRCENSHEWEICFGFHQGQLFVFARTLEKVKIVYRDYITSPEWKTKADDAKERAGHRCQVCNRGKAEGVILNAHHRTYERLGEELPEDITVLCQPCHKLYEDNKDSIGAVTA